MCKKQDKKEPGTIKAKPFSEFERRGKGTFVALKYFKDVFCTSGRSGSWTITIQAVAFNKT